MHCAVLRCRGREEEEFPCIFFLSFHSVERDQLRGIIDWEFFLFYG